MSGPLISNHDATAGLTPDQQMASVAKLLRELLSTLGVDIGSSEFVRAIHWSRQRRQRRPRGLTIAQLCTKYLEFAEGYYPDTGRSSGNEAESVELALRPLRKLFGRTPVAQFGPRRLKLVREEMVRLDWCRRHINHQVGRIKRMLKWATENELIPASIFHAVHPVVGLRAGRTTARESIPVPPAPEDQIAAVIRVVTPQVAAMIQLQLLTGMRPGEVVIMRTMDIDQSVQPWVYRPTRHKTAYHGHERLVFLGPQAQEVIRRFLHPDIEDRFLFRPIDADKERRRRLHAIRKTPMSCGNRRGTNRKRRPKKKPGQRYDSNSYARAVTYACRTAFPIPDGLTNEDAELWRRQHHWHPHQLRHNAATRFRREFGLEVAQVVLGHKTLAVTQVYAERDVDSARKVMSEVG